MGRKMGGEIATKTEMTQRVNSLIWVLGVSLLLLVAGCFGNQADSDAVGQEPASVIEPVIEPVAAPEEESDATEVAVEVVNGNTILTKDNRPRRLKRMTSSWETDWTRRTIEFDEILSGGPPRDGIASIDEPTFVSADEAAAWLMDNEPVISLEIDGEARAYPIQILMWHEIVNDTLAGVPVAVTFCPLCNSALTFDRRFDSVGFDGVGSDDAGSDDAGSDDAGSDDAGSDDAGSDDADVDNDADVDVAFEFGTSGLLRNSDLIMYDRTTETLWQQFTGEGLVGQLAGERLRFIPSSLVSFADFREAFPDGEILSNETGFVREYGRNPYAGYDSVDSTPFLFDGELDGRLLPMARVVTVSLDDADVAYPVELLAEVRVINDVQAGQELAIFHSDGTSSALGASRIAEGEDVGATGVFDPNLDGQTLTFAFDDRNIVDEQTGSTWTVLGQATDGELAGSSLTPIVHADHFWFSWAAFKPGTVIYE